MSDSVSKIEQALSRIRELDQTDDSGVDYDGWGNATLRDMSSYATARHVATNLNTELGYEAIKVIPKTKIVDFTIYRIVGFYGNMHPAGESQSSGTVVSGFDVSSVSRKGSFVQRGV